MIQSDFILGLFLSDQQNKPYYKSHYPKWDGKQHQPASDKHSIQGATQVEGTNLARLNKSFV